MLHSERLPSDPSSAGSARRVVERAADELDEESLYRARLLVSELVTNAIEHAAAGAIDLSVERRGERIRVTVADGGPGFDVSPREPGAALESGWGLHFVRELATEWGTSREGGMAVWFEVPARGAMPEAA